ncbi:MAG: hypothetical protein WC317_02115 [Candidatus Omnitrophota bacterium]|jgi:hypothetical protein
MKNLIFILIIPLLRALIYYNHASYLHTALQWHDKWLDGKTDDATVKEKEVSQKAQKWIQANILEIKHRVINIGVEDPAFTAMEPVGLGFGQQRNYSGLDNLLFLNVKILGPARNAILQAEGTYKTQAMLSFSPLYWIEMIIFLPREIIKMAGFKEISRKFQPIVNTVQLVYWLVMIFYTVNLIIKNK